MKISTNFTFTMCSSSTLLVTRVCVCVYFFLFCLQGLIWRGSLEMDAKEHLWEIDPKTSDKRNIAKSLTWLLCTYKQTSM